MPALTNFSKISLFALYWRIVRVTTARRPLQIAAALNIAWGIAAVMPNISTFHACHLHILSSSSASFPCTPICGFWRGDVPSKCINYNAFYTSNQAIAIALDIVVPFRPTYFIANLQRSLSQRFSISSTFLLGMVYVSNHLSFPNIY